MGLAERIFEEVKTLPEDEARKVLLFVEHVKAMEQVAEENRGWEKLSVNGALAGLEGDEFPEYPESELLERW
ncbi:MAG: hypothetical protein KGZ83_20365 [Sulfuricella sp.]|nr:hypothetical protein [Sulfuricella sp.]